ncbi:hypothetical protein Tco_1078897 [Tanacetum coccineum]|uniref:Uncharacterized protein n=1 Tax=Tanacetum coccineum TaxID=301880 RepID=A0ABQ5HRU2_9ASTR
MRRHEWQRQAADDLAVQHIMRTQALEAGAHVDTLEDTDIILDDHTKNETIIFEANLENSQVCIPKKLKWEDIRRNETLNLEEMNQIKPLKLNKDITNIIEHTNGNIQISFGKEIGESSRHSTYVPSSIISENEKEHLRRTQSLKFKRVDFNSSIPKPVYEEDNKSDETVSTYNYKPTEVDHYEQL